ncbi:hypothetical protein GH714_043516 [Hevea brasiliensis]|uniref:Uncharacterized protein n=1 Tax=Hevea brasiliensis TaxID=3981 RepID=A0A6A6K523_HEVBR|nr:hypothetical protein GH714_043516 [Hevea brasiliensis]
MYDLDPFNMINAKFDALTNVLAKKMEDLSMLVSSTSAGSSQQVAYAEETTSCGVDYGEQAHMLGHKQWITAISWEPVHLNAPCRRFVSASEDQDARIWDVSLRKCIICLTGHKDGITCVKWGGDGLIYTGSRDCTIKVWETSQGKLIRELKVALERYNKMKGNGPERLVSGSDDFTLFLWEPAVSEHHKTRMTGHQKLVNHVYFSPDGQWVASASFDGSVKLWNGVTGKFVAAFRGHVGWSADSRLLLSGSEDSTLKVWDIRTRKLKQDLPGHADKVYAIDWSPDGEKVASGGKDGLDLAEEYMVEMSNHTIFGNFNGQQMM